MGLRMMVYQDVRDAVSVRPKAYPRPTLLGSCKSYCRAYKVSYDEEYCNAVIDSMLPEPGEKFLRFLPEGFTMDPVLETAGTFHGW